MPINHDQRSKLGNLSGEIVNYIAVGVGVGVGVGTSLDPGGWGRGRPI